ncbi:hypothetical protein BASA61_003096 [Batrachochytrium salamandrivorans]|nr:hypothetical protein BASA61_003096 [Batrachochytrium salamandrivorans]KAH9249925.1 hypothetical protein BASA81_012302 [Batrachochytrium salamandrivorans]KAH9266513.1 hypothetical protein BASA83_010497 [Batrachochytrium salamandrivorans]
MPQSHPLISASFEVFGRVQGVFFRKYTKEYADALGLVGWVRNTSTGTVVGTAQGPNESIDQLQVYLSTKGSPKSSILKCTFDRSSIESVQFSAFTIDRS